MFCTKCGKELAEGVKFCTACGNPVEMPEAEGEEVSTSVQENITPVEETAPSAEETAPAVEEGEAPARGKLGSRLRESAGKAGKALSAAAGKAGTAISHTARKAQDGGKKLWNRTTAAVDALEGETAAEKGRTLAKKLGWKLPVIAAAVVVIIALLIALFSGAFLSAKTRLALAAKNSVNAYCEAYEDADLPDLGLISSDAARESIFVELEELEGSSMLEGLGMRMDAAYSLQKRALSAQITPFMGSAELMTVQLAVKDNKICVASPQLLEGKFYGVDTETLGADMIVLGNPDLEELSFNLFDMAEYAMKAAAPGKNYEKKLEQAVKDFVKAVQVERSGRRLITVNGTDVKCALYRVTLPTEAVVALAEELENLPADVDYQKIMVNLLSMTGLSEDTVAAVMNQLGEEVFQQERAKFAESVEIMMNALGDVELKVYVRDGYLMAALYEGEVNGDDVEAGVYLGGGRNYVDDFSVVLDVNDRESGFMLSSYGNHTGRGGTFTDETVVENFYRGESMTVLESALRYSGSEKEENFTWVLEAEDVTVDMEGTLNVRGESFSLTLDELEVREDRSNVITLSAGFSVEKYSPVVSPRKTVMLSALTEEDVAELSGQVMEDAMSLLGTLAAEVPALGRLFYSFF